jgi:L,D-transpeptidase YbiS
MPGLAAEALGISFGIAYNTLMTTGKPSKTALYLAAAWLAVFAALAAAAARNYGRLATAAEKLDSLNSALGFDVRTAAELSKEIGLADEDLVSLSGLAARYPENKGHFRTQNAIAAEVRELRKDVERKIGRKLYAVVDSRANKLYLKRGVKLLWEADCSVGKGGTLRDKKTGRIWEFATPRGEFTVLYKIDDPAWIKPDWAYVESGEAVPPREDPSRLVRGELGKYALDIGNGYLLHGTRNEDALGTAVSHGCVRLGAEALEKLYKTLPVGAKIYIY